MKDIEFSIGPSNKEAHEIIIVWLNKNLFDIKDISFNGDHYSEIYVYGDYNKAYNELANLQTSFEHWELVVPVKKKITLDEYKEAIIKNSEYESYHNYVESPAVDKVLKIIDTFEKQNNLK